MKSTRTSRSSLSSKASPFASVGDGPRQDVRRRGQHVQRFISVVVLLALFGACGRTAPIAVRESGGVAVDDAGAKDRQKLSIAAEALAGQWETAAHFRSRPGSSIPMDLTASLLMSLRPQTATELDVYLERIGIEGEAGGRPMVLGPISSEDARYAKAFDSALSSIRFDGHGPTLGTPNANNPLARQGHNLIHTAVFSIPALPQTPVGVGASWRSQRVIPRSSDAGPEVSAEIHFKLLELGPCDSEAAAMCATIGSKADTGMRDEVHKSGAAVKVRYTLDGKSRIRLGGGLVSADIEMTMELEMKDVRIELDGSVTTRMP